MGAPLQFLRDWLPFGPRHTTTDSGDELRVWLDQLTGQTPEQIAVALTATLPKVLRAETNLPMRRMLLDALQAEAARLVPPLAAAIDRSPLPLRGAARKQAIAADNLLKLLAEGYQSLAGELLAKPAIGNRENLLRHAILHAIRNLAHRQRLAYRAYTPASDGSWRQLHQLYRLARERGLTETGPTDERIVTHYLAVLLLAFADPTKFSRDDLDRIAAVCLHVAPQLRVIDCHSGRDAPSGAAQFIVRLAEGHPGRKNVRVEPPSIAEEIVVDCTAAVALLQIRVSGGTAAAAIADPTDPLAAAAPLLPALLDMWRGVPGRRYSRQSFKPRVDLVAGADALWLFLSGMAFGRRRSDRAEVVDTAPLSEWSLVDESPDGFGVRFIRGELPGIEVGEIVGLRSRERSTVHVCIVRRISNLGSARLELGLQELSSRAAAIALPAGRAILLPAMPGQRGAAGLVSLPGSIKTGATVALPVSDFPAQATVGEVLECNRRCEIRILAAAANTGPGESTAAQ